MKRLATDNVSGPARARKRARTTSQSPDDDPESENDISDDESRSTVASTCPADTPITPTSPRKYPSDLKTIECTYPGCDKTFNRPVRLAAHLRSHTNERPFKCPHPDCGKDYIEEKHLKQHIKGSHTTERDYTCAHEGCGKQFMTATRLRRHQLVHKGEERFRCRDFPPCNESFRKHQTLQRHVRTVHQHEPAYLCEHLVGDSGAICGQGFESPNSLRRHQEREHGDIRFWCEECASQRDDLGNPIKVGFPTSDLLKAHMKQSHVKCVFCGRSCNGKKELARHIELDHTPPKSVVERKTFACTWPGCTKNFTRQSNLKTHIRGAHEGFRFVCGQFDLSKTPDLSMWSNSQGCGDTFSLKISLENHVRYVHLMHKRPAPKSSEAPMTLEAPSNLETPSGLEAAKSLETRPASPQRRAELTMLEQLAGVGESSRRTVPCRFSGCHMKFTYTGELEAHIQIEHSEEQALINCLGGASVALESPTALQSVANSAMEWAAANSGQSSWVATNTGTADYGMGLGEAWHRNEADVRQLIGRDGLDGLIDPSLAPRPL